jgi:predicted outer membrane repeat protein
MKTKHCFKRNITFSSCAFILALVLLLGSLYSCKFFYLDLLGELKDKTENVSVSSISFSQTYPVDSDGITCIPSDSDISIQATLINPQLLSLDTAITLPAPALSLASLAGIDTATSSNLYSVVQSDSKTSLTCTYSKAFLASIDGNCTYYTDTDTRDNDIDPTFTLTGIDDSSKSFGPFTPQKIRCNSVPALVTDALVMEKTTPAGSSYVLFFNLPDMTGIHKDVVTLTLSCDGTVTTYPVTTYGVTSSTIVAATGDPSSNLYPSWDTATQGTLSNQNGGTVLEKKYPLYYDTGITATADTQDFIITLTDAMSLSSSFTVTSNEPVLNVSTCSNTATTINQDADSAYATLVWSAPSQAHYKTTNGTTSYVDVDASKVSVTVKIFSGLNADTLTATPLSSTTSLATNSILLPHGNFTVETTASTDGYLRSVEKVNYTVTQTTAYVDGTASSSLLMNGSKENPYATILQAFNGMASSTDTANTIILCTDMTESVTLAGTSSGNASLTIKTDDDTVTRNITSLSDTFTLTSGTLTLKNVTVTTTTPTDYAAKVDASSSLTIYGATTLTRISLANEAYITVGGTLTSVAATDDNYSTSVATIVPQTYRDTSFDIPLIKTTATEMTASLCDLFVIPDNSSTQYYVISGTTKSGATESDKQFGYLQKVAGTTVKYSQTNGLSGNELNATTRFVCDPTLPVTYEVTTPVTSVVTAKDHSGNDITGTVTTSALIKTTTYTLTAPETSDSITLTVGSSIYTFIYGGVCVGQNSALGIGTKDNPFTTFTQAITALGKTAHTVTSGGSTTSYDTIYLVSNLLPTTTEDTSCTYKITTSLPTAIVATLTGNTITAVTNTNTRAVSIDSSGGALSISGVTITGGGGSATNGGGIYLAKGNLTLCGTTAVTGNTAANGGGIYVGGGTLSITGDATVTGNTATNGGGIYVGGGSVAITSNAINSNTLNVSSGHGTQVYFNDGTITLSGAASIVNQSQTDATHASVYLATGKSLTVCGALTATGIIASLEPQSYPTDTTTVTVLSSSTTPSYTITAADISHFVAKDSSDGSWQISTDTSTIGQLIRHKSSLTLTVTSGIDTATFTIGSTSIGTGSTITITALLGGTTKQNKTSDCIVYLNGTQIGSTANTTYPSATFASGTFTAPDKPGTYTLTICFTDNDTVYSTSTTITVI